jgi:hypothetical protein
VTKASRSFAVLVGAGASHGAGRVTPEPPPLGNDLYASLRDRYPKTWGAVTGGLDTQFRENFELGMNDAWTRHSEPTQALLIDMGRAFALFRPPMDGSDHYTTLVRSVVANRLLARCVIGSLNYECIFELAANRLGVPIGYGRGHRPSKGLVVLKPHGSCNLLPPRQLHVTSSSFVEVGAYYDGPLEPRQLDELEAFYTVEDYSFPPAMSLYAPGKRTPVAPGWVDRQRQEWRAAALSADAIAVIGVRPIWDDAHVWDPVIKSRADLWYIGGGSEHKDLTAKVGRNVLHLGQTFDEGVGPLVRLLRLLA